MWGEYMKNAINYYYNMSLDDIHFSNNIYSFKYENNFYSFILFNDENVNVNEIYKLQRKLNDFNIYTHQIISNIFGQLITTINGNNYILIKKLFPFTEKIKLNDIINYTNVTNYITNYDFIDRRNWYLMWSNKVDYIEYQINQFGNKYPNIKESMYYFLGMIETGIELLVNEEIKNIDISICHKRIKRDYTLFDLYNPLNFVIDSKVRDVAEYFKSEFLDSDPYDQIIIYINTLSYDQIKLFFIRMLYPSFYIDLYENIIDNRLSDKEIKKSINKIDSYELLLKKIYLYIKQKYNFPNIEWLNNTI